VEPRARADAPAAAVAAGDIHRPDAGRSRRSDDDTIADRNRDETA
jgi:hypothetical protein